MTAAKTTYYQLDIAATTFQTVRRLCEATEREPDFVYTEEQAMAETQSMEGQPGHLAGCTTYAACMASDCRCSCHD